MKSKDDVRLIWSGKDMPIDLDEGEVIKEIQKVYPNIADGEVLNGDEILLSRDEPINGRLIKGLNTQVIQHILNSGYKGKFDLIYMDPPYFSAANYHSKLKIGTKEHTQVINRPVFTDLWKSLDEYLAYVYKVIIISKELLSDQGSLFVHLDWHASHYVKIILDEVFSRENFINEIIWCYGGGSNTKRHFQKKHDTIFWYGKTKDYIFNPQYRPYTEKTLARGLTKVKGPKYVLNKQGALMQDWWTDINKILSPTAYENLKFPTQKPLALLTRIIKTASNPGSLVGDFFVGSGTTLEACEQNNRDWIACDDSNIAIQTSHLRLLNCLARPYQIEMLNSTYTTAELKLLLNRQADDLVVALDMEKDLVDMDIAFYEMGTYDNNIFNSLIQVIPRKEQGNKLAKQVLIRNITARIDKIAVKAYDFRGNIIMCNYL